MELARRDGLGGAAGADVDGGEVGSQLVGAIASVVRVPQAELAVAIVAPALDDHAGRAAELLQHPEAVDLGLAYKCVDTPEALMPSALELARSLAAGPTRSLGLSKALLNAPCPPEVKRLGAEACDIYRDKIEQAVAGVDEEAVKRYGVTLQKAGELGVSNEWTKLARTRANAYSPDKFPMTKDERIDFQMENP